MILSQVSLIADGLHLSTGARVSGSGGLGLTEFRVEDAEEVM